MKLAVVCVVALLSLGDVSCVNPGFRAIFTQKALDYAIEVGFPLLKQMLNNITIPSATYYYKGPITVDFTISNVEITSLNFGRPSLTSDTKGVVLSDDGISMSITADWSYEEENWPHLKDRGTVDISVGSVSLAVSVDLTQNKTSGGICLNMSSCSFTANNFIVHFHGGASWLYNLFSSVIEGAMRKAINDKACSSINDEITNKGNALADTLQVGYGVEFDYSLVADPDFSHKGYIMTEHKGEFLLISNPQDPPFSPAPLPDTAAGNYSKMVYIQATTYIVESASYTFWKAGRMAYNLSNDQLPSGFQTTTSYCCLITKELCNKYPDMKVMFGIAASDYPRLEVTPEYAVMHAKANASMYVDNGDLVFTLALSVQAHANVYLKYNTSAKQDYIYGNVSQPKISVSLAKSNIGNFNCSSLKNLITSLAPTLGLAYINNYILSKGVPLVAVAGVSFYNTSLAFRKGYVEVSGDVAYNPNKLGSTAKMTHFTFFD